MEVADPEIDRLPAESRAKLGAIWDNRGATELRVASSFCALLGELFEHGAPQIVYEILGQAVRDEVRHGQISIEIAARYRSSEPVWPAPVPTHLPPFKPSTGALHATLFTITMCCVNETFACAILEGGIAQTKSPLVRAGLRSILADEIDHARAGWAYLGSQHVTADTRRELPKWLPRLHGANHHELLDEDSPLPGEEFVDHGILSRARRQEILHDTLFDVTFPGYRRAGIDTSFVEKWARTAFERTASRAKQTA